MNLFADIRSLILSEIAALTAAGTLPAGLSVDAVTVEPPRDRGHGDMATNAAMVLAKPAGMAPRARLPRPWPNGCGPDPRITERQWRARAS